MSQFNEYDSTFQAEPSGERTTSGLAIWSLVCSLIFCCPLTTIVGVIMGLVAFVTIGSNPMKKGRGLAVAAILIGVVATAGQGGAGWAYWQFIAQPVVSGPDAALTAGFAGDTAGMLASMELSPDVTEAQAEAFIGELRSRYGEYNSAAILGQANAQMGAQTQTFQYQLQFSNGSASADMDIVFADPGGNWVMKPDLIVVHDSEKGDLYFPPNDDG